MFETLRNAFKIPELRKRLLYTLMMFVIIRLGTHLTVVGVDPTIIKEFFESSEVGVVGLFDAITGGALKNYTIFALGIVPYINASIIMNLLTVAIPKLEEIQKEGEEGRKKIGKYTRILTVILAAIQALFMSLGFRQIFVSDSSLPFALLMIIAVVSLTAGTAFLMWIGEKITEKGIGNGISLIIFVNIISRAPEGIKALYQYSTEKLVSVIILLILFVFIIAFVVLLQVGERRIPVQYAKKVSGRKVYGGQSTHIPLKVNMAGVIPIIFASSLIQFPSVVTSFFGGNTPTGTWGNVLGWLSMSHWFGATLYVVLIIFFAYFYTSISFNPMEVANNMKRNGGFIPGIRPGKPTLEYLNKVLSYLVFIGAVALALIALMPVGFSNIFKMNVSFGGTSLLIVVGVALETVKQMEAHMLMRHYKGFLNS